MSGGASMTTGRVIAQVVCMLKEALLINGENHQQSVE